MKMTVEVMITPAVLYMSTHTNTTNIIIYTHL